jgi:hypothetical protein
MPALIKLTAAQCRALRKRYEKGTSLTTMVKEFGFSRIVLTNAIKRAGGKIRPRGRMCEKPIKGRCQCRVKHSRPRYTSAKKESREQQWRRQGSRPPKGFPLQPHEILLKKDVDVVYLEESKSNKTAAKRTAILFTGGATVVLLISEFLRSIF